MACGLNSISYRQFQKNVRNRTFRRRFTVLATRVYDSLGAQCQSQCLLAQPARAVVLFDQGLLLSSRICLPMENLLRLLPGPQPILIRYGITIGMVLLTFALRLQLQERTGQYGFILFVPAIVAASLMFDRGSGFLALGLSTALIASLL